VIRKFASWGVDFLKLDFMTPGSPDAGEELPDDNSGAAVAYHNAIKNVGMEMRLDISWKLDRTNPFWGIWKGTSDSLRVDQDINNSGQDIFVAYSTVLRTLDFYRGFINEQTAPERNGVPIMVCV
jgi:alpha-galactosidase